MFDIVQFFSSLNHQLLLIILNKVDFDIRISQFLSSYLINRQTQYIWNYFILPSLKANVGVGQGFALFSIFSAFYIASLFYIFEKRTKNLLIPFLFFLLLMMVFLFFRRRVMKSITWIFTVVQPIQSSNWIW